jgi:hypothetical protein
VAKDSDDVASQATEGQSNDSEEEASRTTEGRGPKVFVRLTGWVVFGAVVSLLPLIKPFSGDISFANGFKFDWRHILGTGELFIVGAVLAAGAFGEILMGEFSGWRKVFAVLAAAFTFLIFLSDTLAYWIATGSAENIAATAHGEILRPGLALFISSVVAGGACVYLAVEK